MGKTSRFIKGGSSNHESKLIKAMKGWDSGEFFSDAPSGVFGCEATIKSNGVVIKSSELDIEFQIPFDDDLEFDEAEIIVYNLSDTTANKFVKGQKITVEAGFHGDTGLIFTGYIDKKTVSSDGADRKMVLKCLDRTKTTTLKGLTYRAGTTASAILKDLIGKTGTQVEVFKVRRDYTFKDEQKIDGSLVENIGKFSGMCGVSTYLSKGKIYCRWLKEADGLNFTVSEDTGLIGTPTSFVEEVSYGDNETETINGWECECLLQHRFAAGGKVNLKSQSASGAYRIKSGVHTFADGEALSKVKMF